MIIVLDDSFVVPVPKFAKVTGFFRPFALTTVSPQDRQEVARRLASATTGWNAVAIGLGGRFGLELGAASEEAAVSDALQACGREDNDCHVAVIGPFLVEHPQ